MQLVPSVLSHYSTLRRFQSDEERAVDARFRLLYQVVGHIKRSDDSLAMPIRMGKFVGEAGGHRHSGVCVGSRSRIDIASKQHDVTAGDESRRAAGDFRFAYVKVANGESIKDLPELAAIIDLPRAESMGVSPPANHLGIMSSRPSVTPVAAIVPDINACRTAPRFESQSNPFKSTKQDNEN